MNNFLTDPIFAYICNEIHHLALALVDKINSSVDFLAWVLLIIGFMNCAEKQLEINSVQESQGKVSRGLHLVILFLAVFTVRFQALAQYTSTTDTSRLSPALSEDSPISLALKSRLFAPYSNTAGNGWLNELTLTYDLSPKWSIGLWTGYTQYFDPSMASTSDLYDTELFVSYTLKSSEKKYPKTTFQIYFAPVLPTSTKVDNLQTETGGLAIKDDFIYDLSYLKFEQYLAVYQYFYRNQSDVGTQANAETNKDSDNDFTLINFPTVPTQPTLTYNAMNYIDSRFIGVLPIVRKPLKLRNEIRFESYQNADGSALNIIHDVPGIGYVWSKHVSTWLSEDCYKKTNSDSSIFDKNNMVTYFTVYLSI